MRCRYLAETESGKLVQCTNQTPENTVEIELCLHHVALVLRSVRHETGKNAPLVALAALTL